MNTILRQAGQGQSRISEPSPAVVLLCAGQNYDPPRSIWLEHSVPYGWGTPYQPYGTRGINRMGLSASYVWDALLHEVYETSCITHHIHQPCSCSGHRHPGRCPGLMNLSPSGKPSILKGCHPVAQGQRSVILGGRSRSEIERMHEVYS